MGRAKFDLRNILTEATQTSKALTHNFVTVPRKFPNGPTNLVGLTRVDLREVLIENGTPEKQANMRVSQIWQWIYEKGVRDFDQMTNLSLKTGRRPKALPDPTVGSNEWNSPGTPAARAEACFTTLNG